MRLAFVEEELNDVDVQLQRLWQRNLVRSWRPRVALRILSGPVTDRYDLRNGRVAIHDGDRFAAPYRTQIFTESSLQFCDPHGSMTTSSHDRKREAETRLRCTKRRANDLEPMLRNTSSKLSINSWSLDAERFWALCLLNTPTLQTVLKFRPTTG